MKSRFIAEAADGAVLALPVRVTDEHFLLHVGNNELRVDQAGQPDEGSIEITREQLIGLTTRTLHPSDVITGSEQSVRLAALIEAQTSLVPFTTARTTIAPVSCRAH